MLRIAKYGEKVKCLLSDLKGYCLKNGLILWYNGSGKKKNNFLVGAV
jgi:hypothetical protein